MGIYSNVTGGRVMTQLADGRWVESGSPEAMQAKRDQATKQAADLAAQQKSQQATVTNLAKMADPFAGQRGQYQTQLKDLMTNPSAALEKNPFFSASNEQGMEAANRKLAQMGMSTSGNAAFELQKASQANMSDSYFKMADLLSGLGGAKADPSAGAQAAISGMNMLEEQRQFDQGKDKFRVFNGGMEVKQPSSGGFTLGGYWGK